MRKIKSKLRSESGFTLVELMMTVVIVGVLAAIAVPNYSKYQARARQAEAKIALSSIYAVEVTFFPRFSSYSLCLESIGYTPMSGLHYYSVGFKAAAAYPSTCGPGGIQSCNVFNWSLYDDSIAAHDGKETKVMCPAADSQIFFAGNTSDGSDPVPTAALFPDNVIERTKFSVDALGAIWGGGVPDHWQVNEQKQVILLQTGIVAPTPVPHP